MCNPLMVTEEKEDQYARCPRTDLGALELAAKEIGFELLVGREIEFKLISPKITNEYAGGGPFSTAAYRSPDFAVVKRSVECIKKGRLPGVGLRDRGWAWAMGDFALPLEPARRCRCPRLHL
jgi:hypothetical protein